jgi:hypothetical protein
MCAAAAICIRGEDRDTILHFYVTKWYWKMAINDEQARTLEGRGLIEVKVKVKQFHYRP